MTIGKKMSTIYSSEINWDYFAPGVVLGFIAGLLLFALVRDMEPEFWNVFAGGMMAILGGVLGAGYTAHRADVREYRERLRQRRDIYRIVENQCLTVLGRVQRDVNLVQKPIAVMNRTFVEQNLSQGVRYPKVTVPIEVMANIVPFLAVRASAINSCVGELEGLLERMYLSLLIEGQKQMTDEQWTKFSEGYLRASRRYRDQIEESINDVTGSRIDEFNESVRPDPRSTTSQSQ